MQQLDDRKKIGLVTIIDQKNYGNRLQNYAAQEVLRSLGCQVETIVNKPLSVATDRPVQADGILSKARQLSHHGLLRRIGAGVMRRINRKSNQRALARKRQAFRAFTLEHIAETPYEIQPESIPADLGDRFDAFIVGSDQVWNPTFRHGSSFDFLTFAPHDKRIALSASFGIAQIPDAYQSTYRQWLSDMAYISVREQAGARIVADLTGRTVPVLVDPTLLIDKSHWLNLAKPEDAKPRKPYLLTYFLGDVDPAWRTMITEIARKKKLAIVGLADLKAKTYYAADPAAFLDYVHSATIVMTDSFHGTVFSILFGKPFIVFDRSGKTPAMHSRLDDLLSLFHLEHRRYDRLNSENLKLDALFDIDHDNRDTILAVERQKAEHYLRMALNIRETT